jgi:integrase
MSRWLADALPAPWTGHCLRHAFATDAYLRTRDLVLVAELLGHASTRTTERYVLPENARAAAAVAGMSLAA